MSLQDNEAPYSQACAPRRYQTPRDAHRANLRLVWTTREKKELLRGLKALVSEKDPEVTVQGRSDAEVSSYFSWLCSRAAREAVQTLYGKLVHQKKIPEIPDPAPIELWTDLASRVCSTTEEAMTAAFSQVLTIASTEPVTLRHSIPCKEPSATSGHMSSPGGKSLQHTESSEEELGSSGEEPTTEDHDNGWNSLDFENIYKYLSKAVRGEELPRLSDFESAVIVRLLHCIPDQFRHLYAPQIGLYLYDTYNFLTTHLGYDATEGRSRKAILSRQTGRNWDSAHLTPS